ncbi:uracil-DNA glycosylase [Aureimonas jatrophae]|jgi:uracil-DNA glycosylase|uniref:Uracil DNA glycosylase superfamily protein n=1 Tax=Aureimonas jatrophae TaxID=1166073 RepID=A0A1H0NJ77_9HYPH|nr:uracil-DNA glycosylase [Aureimonas jatrophae]MBB3948929.1 uracil-DNA glycosylase [Aureimonas jatrophae]SDO92719.1 Uracil DNA glycosylase superfamily protein [Aureimonas jatrophae]
MSQREPTLSTAAPDAAVDAFLDALVALPGSDRLFNFYRDHDPTVENADAPSIRRDNLRRVLAWHGSRAATDLWLGEAPAWSGTRQSGVPFVGEYALPLLSGRLGLDPPLRRATRTAEPARSTQTAREIWRALEAAPMPLFWNAVPFHPHPLGEPRRNRTPGVREIEAARPLLAALVELAGVRRILCVGRIAERAAAHLELPRVPVRHPAQGGAAAFRLGAARFLAQT